MLLSLGLVVLGLVFLVWGADRFVAGASATARNLGVSPLIIGLTVIGFGTSAPEMVVSAVASFKGNPGLAVGNAIGSNIANIALIIGISAIIVPLKIQSGVLKREYPILIIVTLFTIILMIDLFLSRSNGILLLLALFVMTTSMAFIGMNEGETDIMEDEYASEIPSDMSTRVALSWTLLGMVILPISSHVLVLGATDIATRLGVSDVVIGLTIVAIGTSLPELAASIAAVMKKEHDLVVGNIIGSNMFNLLGVLGIASIISPVAIQDSLLYRDTLLMATLTIVLLLMSFGRNGPGYIRRWEGVLLLATFLAYQGYLMVNETGLLAP